jgi:hypothetical protein
MYFLPRPGSIPRAKAKPRKARRQCQPTGLPAAPNASSTSSTAERKRAPASAMRWRPGPPSLRHRPSRPGAPTPQWRRSARARPRSGTGADPRDPGLTLAIQSWPSMVGWAPNGVGVVMPRLPAAPERCVCGRRRFLAGSTALETASVVFLNIVAPSLREAGVAAAVARPSPVCSASGPGKGACGPLRGAA